MKELIRDYILAAIGILILPALAILGLLSWIKDRLMIIIMSIAAITITPIIIAYQTVALELYLLIAKIRNKDEQIPFL